MKSSYNPPHHPLLSTHFFYIFLAFLTIVFIQHKQCSKTLNSLLFYLQFDYQKLDKTKLLVDMHTSHKTEQRIKKYHDYISNKTVVQEGLIKYRAIFPKGERIDKLKYIEIYNTNCSSKKRDGSAGLACREDEVMIDFINKYKGINWYFRAIDDSWVSPNNMLAFIKDLEKIVDPRIHVVIKAGRNDFIHDVDCPHGGSGWLYSRAALEALYERGVTFQSIVPWCLWNMDDQAQATIFWRLFGRVTDWNEQRIASADENGFVKNKSAVMREWMQLETPNSTEKCDRRYPMYRLRDLLAFHTSHQESKREYVYHHESYDPKYYFQKMAYDGFKVCVDDPKYGPGLDTVEELAKRTPLLRKDQVPKPFFRESDKKCRLQFSMRKGVYRGLFNKFCEFGNREIVYTYNTKYTNQTFTLKPVNKGRSV